VVVKIEEHNIEGILRTVVVVNGFIWCGGCNGVRENWNGSN
jgi:predicted metal-binding protein